MTTREAQRAFRVQGAHENDSASIGDGEDLRFIEMMFEGEDDGQEIVRQAAEGPSDEVRELSLDEHARFLEVVGRVATMDSFLVGVATIVAQKESGRRRDECSCESNIEDGGVPDCKWCLHIATTLGKHFRIGRCCPVCEIMATVRVRCSSRNVELMRDCETMGVEWKTISFDWFRRVITMHEVSDLVRIDIDGPEAFAVRGYESGMLAGVPDHQLVEALKRPIFMSQYGMLVQLDILILEILARRGGYAASTNGLFQTDQFRYACNVYYKVRELTRRRVTYKAARIYKRSADRFDARILNADTRRKVAVRAKARQLIAPDLANPLRKPLLSDYIDGISPDLLSFGAYFDIRSRDELRSLEWTVFKRDHSMYRSMIESSGPLSEFQTWVTQKIASCPKFAARVVEFETQKKMADALFSQSVPRFQSGNDRVTDAMGSAPLLIERLNDLHSEAVLQTATPRFSLGMLSDQGGVLLSFATEVAAIATAIHQMHQQRTTLGVLQILFLYVKGLNLPGLYAACQEQFASWMVDGFMPTFQQSVMDDLLEEVVSFLGVANVTALLFGDEVSGVKFFHSRFRDLSKRADGDDIIKRFWKAFVEFVKAVKECVVTQSIDPLFSPQQSPARVLHEARALHDYRNQLIGLLAGQSKEFLRLREEGEIPKYWSRPFTQGEYYDAVRERVKALDDIASLLPAVKSAPYRKAAENLRVVLVADADSFSANSPRIPPLGIAFVGPPGTGKSVLVNHLGVYLGSCMGFATDASGRYDVQIDTNFQDNADPMKWHWNADDLDAAPKEPAAGHKNHVDVIIDVVNTRPMPVESARVEEKGKNFGRPCLFTYCTNSENLNTVKYARDRNAVFRRLPIKCVVTAKEQFSTNGFMDPQKAKGHVNIHNIEVFLFNGQRYEMYRVMDDEELFAYILERFKQHLSSQAAVLGRADVGTCALCPMPVAGGVTHCRAHLPQTQGASPSMFTKVDRVLDGIEVVLNDVRQRQVVQRVAEAARSANDLATAPLRAASAAVRPVVYFGQWILENPIKTAMALGSLVAVVVMLSTTVPTMQMRTNNSTSRDRSQWVAPSSVQPSAPLSSFHGTTWSKDEAVRTIQKSIIDLRYGNVNVWALRVGKNLLVTVAHVFKTDREGEIELRLRNQEDKVRRGHFTCVQCGMADVVLVTTDADLSGVTNSFPFFFNDIDVGLSTYDEVLMVDPDGVAASKPATRNRRLPESATRGGIKYVGDALMTDFPTNDGDCGLPYLARQGNYWRVVAIHHLEWNNCFTGKYEGVSGVMVSRAMLTLAGAKSDASFQSREMIPFCAPLDLQPLTREYSEVKLAASKGAPLCILGHDAGAKGRSASKSSCRKSWFFNALRPVSLKHLGHEEYWQVPDLRGGMIDGQWRSGYQDMFTHYSSATDQDGLAACVADYVAGFEDLDLNGYRELSEQEAFDGLLGSVIGPVNMRTSMGPPVGGPKTAHISDDRKISPVLASHLAEIDRLLAEGKVPIPLGQATIKDEPIKKSKNETHSTRVFTILPAAFNIKLKQVFAPIKSFFRNNPFVCESMVGIDMTSVGGEMIRQRFALLDPGLAHVYEGDFTKMDKTINGGMARAVTEVFVRVAELIDVDSAKVRLLMEAVFGTVYSIHNDLFTIPGLNPSGCDITVEINSIVCSLVARYVYFSREGFDAKSPFRMKHVLVTYGDDFLLGSRVPFAESCFESTRKIGMIITDAHDKTLMPRARHLFDCTFLKRNFKVNPKTGEVQCGLALPSILRMILVLRKPALSDLDHHAIVLETAMCEVYWNVELDFEYWRTIFIALADQFDLWRSGYLRLLDRGGYEAECARETFRTWGKVLEETPVEGSFQW